jgi:CobQ-like glutamine amidotransferase family enzyme
MTAVTILQLYPGELGVAGDRGNVMAIRERLTRAGVAVSIVEHTVGAEFPENADLVIVGSGPISAMRTVHDDLLGNADQLRALLDAGVPLFAYGSGAELLGKSITLRDGSVLAGLDVLPFSAERVEDRKVGYVLTETPFGGLVGFEDNASVWHLNRGAVALGVLLEGGGNSDGSGEGVIDGSRIATQIGGPVLPLNPLLTDAVIGFMSEHSGFDYVPAVADNDLDSYAARARDVIVSHAKHVFSRI